jgi:hypothetical protein
MGASTAEKVREIEQTRERLADDFEDLEDRMPAIARMSKRAIGIVAGGGIGGTAFWFMVKRMRGRKGHKRHEQPVNLRVEVPESWGRMLEDDRAKAWATGAAATYVVLRLMELRQLRALRRSIAA